MKTDWFVCEKEEREQGIVFFLKDVSVEKDRDNPDGNTSILSNPSIFSLIGDISTDFCVKHLKQPL